LKNSTAISDERIWPLGMSLTSAAMSQKTAIPRNPDKNALPGLRSTASDTTKATMAIVHQGRKYSATAEPSAINIIAVRSFIN